MDRADWHCDNDLVMPENITAVFPFPMRGIANDRAYITVTSRDG